MRLRRSVPPGVQTLAAAVMVLAPGAPGLAQAVPPSGRAGPAPAVEEVRKKMAIPSTDDTRGQMDGVGYATTPEQMRKVWDASALPPAPESVGEAPPRGSTIAAIIAPATPSHFVGYPAVAYVLP